MSANAPAILEHKKQPFLKAFLRTGKVAPATRAVRISRDAVYDWLRADSAFRRDFNRAKRGKFDHETVQLAECMEVFLSIIKPIIPAELYHRVIATINLTLTNRKFKAGSTSTDNRLSDNRLSVRTASRKQGRLPSFDVHPEPANSVNGGSRVLPPGKNETLT